MFGADGTSMPASMSCIIAMASAATEKLPTLEKHLQMAKELQSKYAK